jgi:DNA-binding CsgD family transcriptional regulator
MRQRPDDAHRSRSDRVPPLNERDLETLRHLADGRSTAQIAAALSISSNTARSRIRRLQVRLAVPDREQIVDAARRLGVV